MILWARTVEQSGDVAAAVAYLAKQPFVDPLRIAVNGTSKEDGHAFCMGGVSPPWGNDVLAFLSETMSSPF